MTELKLSHIRYSTSLHRTGRKALYLERGRIRENHCRRFLIRWVEGSGAVYPRGLAAHRHRRIALRRGLLILRASASAVAYALTRILGPATSGSNWILSEFAPVDQPCLKIANWKASASNPTTASTTRLRSSTGISGQLSWMALSAASWTTAFWVSSSAPCSSRRPSDRSPLAFELFCLGFVSVHLPYTHTGSWIGTDRGGHGCCRPSQPHHCPPRSAAK